jgi:hypothetical protein
MSRVRVFRLNAPIVVAAAVIGALSCLMSGNAMASTATAGGRLMPVATRVGAWYTAPDAGIAAAPSCGKGVTVRKVVAKYKAKSTRPMGSVRIPCTAGTAATAIATSNRTSGSTSAAGITSRSRWR